MASGFSARTPARQAKVVQHGGIHAQQAFAAASDLVLGHHKPLEGAGTLFQQFLEGPPDIALVVELAARTSPESRTTL
jgi:hypothetical protein